MSEQELREQGEEDLTVEELAKLMKGNEPMSDERQSLHSFLFNIAEAKDTTKVGYLRDDKEINELGLPDYSVRGSKKMSLIAEKIMGNEFFKSYFDAAAENTLATSLSRDGFLVRQGTTQTRQVADTTKKRKINKGWFGKQSIEEQGGDTIVSNK